MLRGWRRHHSNKGYKQIKEDKTQEQVKKIAKKLNIKYGEEKEYCPDNPDHERP